MQNTGDFIFHLCDKLSISLPDDAQNDSSHSYLENYSTVVSSNTKILFWKIYMKLHICHNIISHLENMMNRNDGD